MDDIFLGKRLLIGVDNESVLKSSEVFLLLQERFKDISVTICIGYEETVNRILKEVPDVVFLHFDEDPSLKVITDIQWQVHEINKLNCKLIVYSQHKSHSYVLEAINRILFLNAPSPAVEICDKVYRSLRSKGMKILIAMNREAAVNYIRHCINIFYPGNHVIYEISPLKSFAAVLHECPDIVIIDFKSYIGCEQEETFALLDRIRASDKIRIKPIVLVWSPFDHLKEKYLSKGATGFYLWRDHLDGDEVKAQLQPYLGDAGERVLQEI